MELGSLAQLEGARALLVARQFESFNRMSAFVVHDLKNLVAQLALLLRNAERHRNNPEFQRDMLDLRDGLAAVPGQVPDVRARLEERDIPEPVVEFITRDWQRVLQFIFEPGFSTADKVTNLSGRGVGMDVVKRNITALRGTVDIRSEEGVGTTVTVRLPATAVVAPDAVTSNFSSTQSKVLLFRSVATTVMPFAAAEAESG